MKDALLSLSLARGEVDMIVLYFGCSVLIRRINVT